MDISTLSALKTYAAARKATSAVEGLQPDAARAGSHSSTSPADRLSPLPPISSGFADAGAVAGEEAPQALSQSAQKFVEVFKNAEATATDFTIGKADAQAVVEALAGAEVALETAVTIRNRVVEAYQEILRMPV